MGMMGPTGGGSKEFDATLSLIQLMQDPKAYEKKLKELSKLIKDSDKKKSESIDLMAKAQAAMKQVVDAETSYLAKKDRFDKEMEEKTADLDQKISLLGKSDQELNQFREELNKFKESLLEREQSLNARDLNQDKRESALKSLSGNLDKDMAEIERKKAILEKL